MKDITKCMVSGCERPLLSWQECLCEQCYKFLRDEKLPSKESFLKKWEQAKFQSDQAHLYLDVLDVPNSDNLTLKQRIQILLERKAVVVKNDTFD